MKKENNKPGITYKEQLNNVKRSVSRPPTPKGEKEFKLMKPQVLRSAEPSVYSRIKIFADDMRENPTPAERVLWDRLKNKQLGVKFRRQHIISNSHYQFFYSKHLM